MVESGYHPRTMTNDGSTTYPRDEVVSFYEFTVIIYLPLSAIKHPHQADGPISLTSISHSMRSSSQVIVMYEADEAIEVLRRAKLSKPLRVSALCLLRNLQVARIKILILYPFRINTRA